MFFLWVLGTPTIDANESFFVTFVSQHTTSFGTGTAVVPFFGMFTLLVRCRDNYLYGLFAAAAAALRCVLRVRSF